MTFSLAKKITSMYMVALTKSKAEACIKHANVINIIGKNAMLA